MIGHNAFSVTSQMCIQYRVEMCSVSFFVYLKVTRPKREYTLNTFVSSYSEFIVITLLNQSSIFMWPFGVSQAIRSELV